MIAPPRSCPRRALALAAAVFALAPLGAAEAKTQLVSVYSRAMNGYSRMVEADGQFKRETYTFAEGERLDGFMRDASIDGMSFMQIAQVLSPALARQGYIPAARASETDLLIFLSWGTTTGYEDRSHADHVTDVASSLKGASFLNHRAPGTEGDVVDSMVNLADAQVDMFLTVNDMANRERDRANYFNAGILGYTKALRDAMFLKTFSTGFATEVIAEVEESRYFVVLRAYDFKTLRSEKKLKQLWETRFSIRRSGNRFDRELPGMATYASRYFGQDIGRLIRRPMRNAEVQVGTPTVVEKD